MMEKLTKEDIQKIALYIPFRVRFGAMLNPHRTWEKFYPAGLIGSIVIQRYDEESNSVEDRSDIGHPKNDDRPILYKLEDMTEVQCQAFIKLITYDPGLNSRQHLAELILNECSPDVFLYALSENFDMFGLISAGKAIDANTLQ